MKNLLVVWKSDNEIDINNFIMPYTFNSKRHGWFNDVELLIWGASQHKVAESEEIQTKIKKIIESGIAVYACKFCADNLEVSEKLSSIGVKVEYTGVYLSEKMKDDTFEVITI